MVIEECKPLSKNKHFKVIEIIKAAPRVSDMKEDADIEKVIHREKTGADADAKAKKAKKEEELVASSQELGKDEAKEEKNDNPESPTTNSPTTES